MWLEPTTEAPMYTLDGIVEQLAQHHQRATYGAVAALLGRPPRSLMQGRGRAPQFCWIVSAGTRMPTGYAPEERDPRLEERPEVLANEESLRAWLENPR